MLIFTKGNQNAKLRKLGEGVYTFSLPAGHSCPGADRCKAKVVEKNGKRVLLDGANQEFRCFSASQEVRYSNVFKGRAFNFSLLKGKTESQMVNLILTSLPKDAKIIRIHVSGDFFNQDYFDAWLSVARRRRDIKFYAYTKSINYWVNRIKSIPRNLKLNASLGGKFDNLIHEYGLKHAKVFFTDEEADVAGYKVDHDDRMAIRGNKNIGLVLHGTQRKGTEAAKIWERKKRLGGGYNYK